jgi:putative flippase GtrA
MGWLSWVALLPTLANHVLSFSAAVPVSYLLQKKFTFRHTGQHRYSLPRFIIANGAAFLASGLTVGLAKDLFGLREVAVIAIVLVIIPTVSFLMMAFWIFIEPNAPGAGVPEQ